ncbi:MAG: hypothetical protein IKL84_00730 [Clostridia bacterium]|nr:hypothetical protein [Clostridia bacterium]
MELNLPIYHFFTNCMAVEHEEPKKCRSGAPYSGSVGTDPQCGFVNVTTFCYRVLLKKCVDGSKVFVTECWTRPPYSPGRTEYEENREEKIFDGTEESLPLMEEWLRTKCDGLTERR